MTPTPSLKDTSPSNNLREQVMFWLDKMLEVTYQQSDKEMHKITSGITADQILNLVITKVLDLPEMQDNEPAIGYLSMSDKHQNDLRTQLTSAIKGLKG